MNMNMSKKQLKKNFIWSKGTRDYTVFRFTGLLCIVVLVLSYVLSIASLLTRNGTNFYSANPVTPVIQMFSYCLLVFLVINSYYLFHMLKRIRAYHSGKGDIEYGRIIQCGGIKNNRRDLILATKDGTLCVFANEHLCFGKSKKSQNAILVPYRNVTWVAYF